MVLRLAKRGTEALDVLVKAVERNTHNYSKAQLRFVIVNDNNRSEIYVGRIDFLARDAIAKSQILDYGNVTLHQQVVEVGEGVKIIRSLAKREPIRVGNTDYTLEGDFDVPHLVPSKKHWGYVKYDWPHTHSYYALRADTNIDFGFYDSLVKPGLPAYPNFQGAISSFLDLSLQNYTTERRVIIVIPDYRARITEVQLSDKKVTLEIDSKDSDILKNVIGKFYLVSGEKVYASDDVQVKDNNVSCAPDFQPEIIGAYLITSTGERLDFRDINIYTSDAEDLVFETPSFVVQELIRRGESQTVEFKEGITENTLAEAVVAFANTDGGLIIVGVDNNSKAVGFRHEPSKIRDTISHMIGSLCEPPPRFDTESVTLEGNIQVLMIRVPKGNERPYILRDRGIFVRRNATNRQITRPELDEFYRTKNQTDTLPTRF